MCLYDGYNSNSDSMTLSFKDEGKAAAGRKTNYFSIYNTASGERIIRNVSTIASKCSIPIAKGG